MSSIILNQTNYIENPLEQFLTLVIIPIYYDLNNSGLLDFSITNINLTTFCILACFLYIFNLCIINNQFFIFLPNIIQLFIENIYILISNLVNDNFKIGGNKFFIYLLTMFIFVFLCNLTGLIPYAITVTSQLSITLFFSLTTFIGGNFLCMKLHQTQILQFFLPSGTSLILALILVPIELISYIFRPIALAVRLFANMMAGHTLLKVVSGFVWSLMHLGKTQILFILLHLITFGSLFFLFGLESAVALIQTYVFVILSTMYISETVQLLH